MAGEKPEVALVIAFLAASVRAPVNAPWTASATASPTWRARVGSPGVAEERRVGDLRFVCSCGFLGAGTARHLSNGSPVSDNSRGQLVHRATRRWSPRFRSSQW